MFSSSPSWMPSIRTLASPMTLAGGLRLCVARCGELLPVARGVARATVAVRQHQQVHLAARRAPLRDGAAGRDLGVVGMREHREDRAGARARRRGARRQPRRRLAQARRGPVTNRTSVRTGTPVAPRGPRSCARSVNAGPAMSRWTHGVVPDELRQEPRRGDGAAPPLADVLDVGDGESISVAVVREQRHLPHRLARRRRPAATSSAASDTDRCRTRRRCGRPAPPCTRPVSVAVSMMSCGFFSAR